MRRPTLSVEVLAVVATAIGVSLYLSAGDKAWRFTMDRGMPMAEAQVFWWLVSLPLAVGAAWILLVSLISASRLYKERRLRRSINALCVGVLGVVALTGALNVGYRWRVLRLAPTELLSPKSARHVFIPEQWRALARFRLHDKVLGPLQPSGVGLRDHPGMIPFDPFLDRRFSFVGLRVEQVYDLLGQPEPDINGSALSYVMPNGPYLTTGRLILSTGRDEQGIDVVRRQILTVRRPEYDRAME